MNRKYESNCGVCRNGSTPKKIPYGSKRTKMWCSSCDCDMVVPVKKKATRQKAKKQAWQDASDHYRDEFEEN